MPSASPGQKIKSYVHEILNDENRETHRGV